MDLNEVVGEVAECNGSRVVLDLFREAVRQSSEAPFVMRTLRLWRSTTMFTRG
jgi:hypothetical protein